MSKTKSHFIEKEDFLYEQYEQAAELQDQFNEEDYHRRKKLINPKQQENGKDSNSNKGQVRK